MVIIDINTMVEVLDIIQVFIVVNSEGINWGMISNLCAFEIVIGV